MIFLKEYRVHRGVTDEVDGCHQEEAEIGEDVSLDVQYTGVVSDNSREGTTSGLIRTRQPISHL